VLLAPAAAAEKPVRVYKRARPVVVAAPVYTWTGFYIGASAGYSWSRDDVDPSGTLAFATPSALPQALSVAASQIAAIPSALSTNANGFIGGGQLGYNHQWNQFVLGIEADFSGLAGRGSNSSNTLVPIGLGRGADIASTTSVDRRLESLGTVRGRIGFTPFDQLLIFGTGGYAFGFAKSSTAITQLCGVQAICTVTFLGPATGSGSQNLSGWTAGGGIEYAFARSWSVKVEYLHYDLGSMTYASTPLFSITARPDRSESGFPKDSEGASLTH
jgi:outer membrane immunogenic protein